MSVVNTYKVLYHFEQNNKKSGPDYGPDYVQAAGGDYSSIKSVLSSNNLLRPGTLVIDAVQEVGHGDAAKA